MRGQQSVFQPGEVTKNNLRGRKISNRTEDGTKSCLFLNLPVAGEPVKSCKGVYNPPKMKPNEFHDLLTSPLASTACQPFWFLVKYHNKKERNEHGGVKVEPQRAASKAVKFPAL